MGASALLALAGCAGQSPSYPFNNAPLPSVFGPGSTATPQGGAGKTAGAVALLVPLTGNLAPVGQALENAAKLAFPDNNPPLDIRDTGGTPTGAAAAAQAAIAAGDGIILGPLLSAEVHAVAPIAQAANVNVLAFTNDSAVDAPGVWAMGITLDEQVARVMQEAAAAGRTQLGGLLPDSEFGHALGTALQTAAAGLGEPSPSITFFDPGFGNLNQAIQDVSDWSGRGASLDAQIRAAKGDETPAGRQKLRELQHQQVAPPPFNALFIGATSGDELDYMTSLLPNYFVNQPQVQFLGPALWAKLAPSMGGYGIYQGAMYAAPDPASAATFVEKYSSVYGGPPPAIADVAFDAAAIAHLAAGEGGFTSGTLTNPSGFTGTDGLLRLQPDGTVLRGLAVFQIAPGGPSIASPAPSVLTSPSS